MERKLKIVIPNADNYRANIPVLTDSKPEYEIVTPRYDNSIMGGRVLLPVLKRRDLNEY